MKFKADKSLHFEAEGHKYWKTVGKEKYDLISVTEFLNIQDLGVDFSDVPPNILSTASQRGTDKHRILELIINKEPVPEYLQDKYLDFTIAARNAVSANPRKWIISEHRIADMDSLIAGTIDAVCETDEGQIELWDLKTAREPHFVEAAWQLSVYKYLVTKRHKVPADNVKLFVLYYTEENAVPELLLKDVTGWIDDKLTESVVKNAKTGEVYTGSKLPLPQNELEIVYRVQIQAQQYERDLNMLKTVKESLDIDKQRFLDVMKKYGLKKFSFNDPAAQNSMSVSYCSPHWRKTFDHKGFKEQHPELTHEIELFEKDTPVQEYVRISFKEKKDVLVSLPAKTKKPKELVQTEKSAVDS